MKNYIKPVVLYDFDLMEGVYAVSGTPQTDVSAWLNWDNQNSGSHSDLRAFIKTGANPGQFVRITCTFIGEGSLTFGGVSGPYTSYTTDGNSITFIREGGYNPNETFSFGFDNVVFTNRKSGTGDDGQHFGAYYPTGTVGDAVAMGDWTISYLVTA